MPTEVNPLLSPLPNLHAGDIPLEICRPSNTTSAISTPLAFGITFIYYEQDFPRALENMPYNAPSLF